MTYLDYFYKTNKKTSFKVRAFVYCLLIDMLYLKIYSEVFLSKDAVSFQIDIIPKAFICFQILNYIGLFLEKKFSIIYLQIYSSLGFFALFMAGFLAPKETMQMPPILFSAISFLYVWVFFGLRFYFQKSKDDL